MQDNAQLDNRIDSTIVGLAVPLMSRCKCQKDRKQIVWPIRTVAHCNANGVWDFPTDCG